MHAKLTDEISIGFSETLGSESLSPNKNDFTFWLISESLSERLIYDPL